MNTPDNPFSLAGKRIILLGGSFGLGLATAKAAAAEGAHVVVVSSNQQRVDDALAQLSSDSLGFSLDLSQPENIKKFFEHIV